MASSCLSSPSPRRNRRRFMPNRQSRGKNPLPIGPSNGPRRKELGLVIIDQEAQNKVVVIPFRSRSMTPSGSGGFADRGRCTSNQTASQETLTPGRYVKRGQHDEQSDARAK